SISDTYSADVVVVIDDTFEEEYLSEFAFNYFTENGFTDGLMLTIDIGSNTFWTSAHGSYAALVREAEIELLDNAYSETDTYYSGIDAYLDACDTLLADLDDSVPAKDAEFPYLIDNADLLTDTEETALAERLEEMSSRLACDVIVLTEASIDKEAQEYADDYFDYVGYGQGENADGIILLVSMDPRKWHVSGCGICNSDLVSLDYICEEIVGYLENESYASCFNSFVDRCDNAVSAARNGEAYKEPFKPVMSLGISVVIGFIIAFIATGVMKGKLKSVRANNLARNYAIPGSLNVYNARDMFLYRQVTYTEKSTDNDSSNGSHTSSSGRSHSGKGGSF
ncbi:MAG: TPM domain-containing protein, partial [Clostridia bacterium]|nr:TPM domain-containing protein [Clostridia bacterium]